MRTLSIFSTLWKLITRDVTSIPTLLMVLFLWKNILELIFIQSSELGTNFFLTEISKAVVCRDLLMFNIFLYYIQLLLTVKFIIKKHFSFSNSQYVFQISASNFSSHIQYTYNISRFQTTATLSLTARYFTCLSTYVYVLSLKPCPNCKYQFQWSGERTCKFKRELGHQKDGMARDSWWNFRRVSES